MANHSYRLLNVFTRGAEVLSGNPLCVFEKGDAFDDRTMQALARQFNLSETTFILPSSRASARVRIFTPSYEMPFAGHPTLGTAHVCRALGLGGNELTLEMTAGVIPVSAKTDCWMLQANAPRWREVAESRETIAAMLALEPRDIGDRPLWVSTGREQLIIPLTGEDAVRRARPQPDALSRIASRGGGEHGVCVRAAEGRGADEHIVHWCLRLGASFSCRVSSSRKDRRYWRIPPPAPPPPISEAGTSRWVRNCRVGSRSRKASRRVGRQFSIWTSTPTGGCASAAKCVELGRGTVTL